MSPASQELPATGQGPRKLEGPFNRRDFYKLALILLGLSVGMGGVTAACQREVSAMEPTPTVETFSTPSPEALIPGAETTILAEKRLGEIIIENSNSALLEDFFGQTQIEEIFRDEVIPFGIKVDGVTYDFVAIPEGKNEKGEVVIKERLAMKVGPYWELLIRTVTPIGEDDYQVMWQHLPGWTPTSNPLVEGEQIPYEPVFWYESKDSKIAIVGFAPPTEVASEINFDRSLGFGIEIPYESTPSVFKLAMARENGVTLPSEKDLEPVYTETISMEFMGVWINTNIITDKSLDPQITKININKNFTNYEGKTAEEALTEFVANTFFECWWKNGPVAHTEKPTDADFQAFMQLWSRAQKGEVSWSKLQFTMKANDLNDGNGYVPEDVETWPMIQGETPQGVRGIREISFVFIDQNDVNNITVDESKNAWYGINLDGENLYVYIGISRGGPNAITGMGLLSQMARLPLFMSENKVSVYKMLGGGGNTLTTYHLSYWAALQVEPANERELRNR